jgi:IS30 family transposase
LSYTRVTYEDRITIKVFLNQGKCKAEIAAEIGKHKSTIGREIARNSGGRGYRYKQADKFAKAREAAKHQAYKVTASLWEDIKAKLELNWSPEQISGRFKLEGKVTLSPETIYKLIYKEKKEGGQVWRHLRRAHRQRKPRISREERRGTLKDITSINKRPKSVEKRKTKGHWERDTMIGANNKSAILVLTDRKSRFNKFSKLTAKKSDKVAAATIKSLKGLPVASITNDRGKEFADHKAVSKKLGIKVYFCDPYSSCQRGSNENRIGILRQYFPKGTDLSLLKNSQIKKAEIEINNRPMKCLDWKTPYEIMMKK